MKDCLELHKYQPKKMNNIIDKLNERAQKVSQKGIANRIDFNKEIKGQVINKIQIQKKMSDQPNRRVATSL
jgi:hypothetical protein